MLSRVARWFIFKPKSPIWAKFKGPQIGKCLFYGHLDYITDIGDILWPFGTFCIHLVRFSGVGIMNREKSGNPDVVHAHLQLSAIHGFTVKHFLPQVIQFHSCVNGWP
jgi:hypothetical protein